MLCVFRHVRDGSYLFHVDRRYDDRFMGTHVLHNAYLFKFDWEPGKGWMLALPGEVYDIDWPILLSSEDWEPVPVSFQLV